MSDLSQFFPSGGGGGIPPFFNEPVEKGDYITDKYYGPSINYPSTESVIADSSRLFFMPFIPISGHTFTAIAIINTGSDSGDKFRLGIYDDSGGGIPNNLVIDAGEVTLDASADTIREISISQSLISSSIYWLAYIGNANISVSGISSSKELTTPVLSNYGFVNLQLTSQSLFRLMHELRSYGALPSVANPDTATVQNYPLIFLKG